MSWSLQLRFICNERLDLPPPHLHQHLAMLNPGQWWIFKRLASILWERLPYSTQTSFTLQRLIPLHRKKSIHLSKHRGISRPERLESLLQHVCLCYEISSEKKHREENKVLTRAKSLKCQRFVMKPGSCGLRHLQGCFSHLFETQNCLNPNWWFLNTISGTLERVTYGRSIRQLILKTKTWQVHLLINSSVGAHIMSATGVLTTINPHFRQGGPYWHIFLIWIFNYSVVPHQIIVKPGTRPERFTQLQLRSRVLYPHEICQS